MRTMKNISAFCIIFCAFLGHSQTEKSLLMEVDSAFRTQFIFLERTLNNNIEKQDFPMQMRYSYKLGEYLVKWNQLEMALDYFKTVLRGSRFITDKTLIVRARIQLATIYEKLGECSKAKHHIKIAEKLLAKDPRLSFEFKLSVPRYLVIASYGPSKNADKLYSSVLKLNNDPDLTKNIPEVYFRRALNHKSEFESLIQQARNQFIAKNDLNGAGHCSNALADFYEITDINLTIEQSKDALKQFTLAKNYPEILASRQRLASLFLQQNDQASASEQLSEISALTDQMTSIGYLGDSISRRNTQIEQIQGSLAIERLQREQEKKQFKTFWFWAIVSGFLALFSILLYLQHRRDKKAMQS